MIVTILTTVFAAVFPWIVATACKWLLPRLNKRPCHFYLGWTCSGFCGAAGYASGQHWLSAAGSTASGLVAVICWWLSRRRRKRAPRAYGAKSRALLAAVVARMRETAKPRPVFRPAPGGSRA